MKIMVAEDETLIRMDLRQALERRGIEVTEARDGEEAVAVAEEVDLDGAFVDVRMPKLDGIEAISRIRRARPIPVVLLTAYTDEELVSRAVDAGIGGYLVKPFREDDLLPALHTAIGRHRDLVGAGRRRTHRVARTPRRPGRRDELLSLAARIFAERGFAETTVQDIAEAVGMLKGSIYYYVSSKEELLSEVVAQADATGTRVRERASALPGRALDRLEGFTADLFESFERDPDGLVLLFREHRGLSDARHRELAARRERYAAFLSAQVSAGCTDGSVRADAEPTLVSSALLEALERPGKVAAASTSLILAGLRP
jgi:CheY-like chemotaxis protein/AcrR family transcriptional regulator